MLMLQELTPRAQDSLVSFGERLSTRLFASYLRSQVCRNTHTEGSCRHAATAAETSVTAMVGVAKQFVGKNLAV